MTPAIAAGNHFSHSGAPMYYPDYETFTTLTTRGNLIPVYHEIMADMDTPVSAFKKIDDGRYAAGRASKVGKNGHSTASSVQIRPVIRSKGETVEIVSRTEHQAEKTSDPLGFVKEYLARFHPVEIDGLPGFRQRVGYLGYDMVRYFERVQIINLLSSTRTTVTSVTDTIVIFDNVNRKSGLFPMRTGRRQNARIGL
jgi:anthranilate synthase component 1